ncbi:MAG: RNA methyltransferase [Alphaproteobacteria bacterium]|nr:RNA methyltransferase [Alphaproteobacteria bacterium]
MAGTDQSQTHQATENAPVVVLVDPQMGENIGAAARAMLNCGLQDLRLVRPRDGWPNEKAQAMSSGALDQMPPVQTYDTTAAALADCQIVYATTARAREMAKPVFSARETAADARTHAARGHRVAYLFGAERTGLTNDDVALAHAVVTIPLNPAFSSLNLGQAVLLLAYEWSQATPLPHHWPQETHIVAPHDQFVALCERLENDLDAHHFFRTAGQKPVMIRNLRTMLARAMMSEQEIRTFHGILSALAGKKTPPSGAPLSRKDA